MPVFSEQDIELIRKEYPSKGSAIQMPGRSPDQIRRMASRLGIAYSGRNKGKALFVNGDKKRPDVRLYR